MSKADLYNSIARCENNINQCNLDIIKAQREIEELEAYKINRIGTMDAFGNNMNARNTRLNRLAGMSERAKSGRVYSAGMSAKVNGGERYNLINGMSNSICLIRQEIEKRYQLIQGLYQAIGSYNNQISSCRQQIARIEAEEAAEYDAWLARATGRK